MSVLALVCVFVGWLAVVTESEYSEWWYGSPECCYFDSSSCNDEVGNLEKIYAVFMSHLDVGYSINTDAANTWSHNGPFRWVCDQYAQNFYKEAIENAEYFKSSDDYNIDYKFTHFPWMILAVLDSTGCSTFTDDAKWDYYVSNLTYGIENDYIIWNGDSLNAFWGTMHELAFNYSLQLKNELNQRFSKDWGKVWKLTDVPGMPSSVVPLLNDSGIYAIHLGTGTNGPLVPDLESIDSDTKLQTWSVLQGYEDDDEPGERPAFLFRWKDDTTSKETIVMLEYGYGQIIKPNNVNEALVFFFTDENSGPPTQTDTELYLDCLKTSFPDATIIGSSLDEFLEDVLLRSDVYESIPVISTSKNLGDGWMYAIQSDPLKIANARQASRIIEANIKAGNVQQSDDEFKFYMRKLHKASEHNGGLQSTRCGVPSSCPTPNGASSFTTSKVLSLLGTELPCGFKNDSDEWIAQREFTYPPNGDYYEGTISSEWQAIFDNLTTTFDSVLKPSDFDIDDIDDSSSTDYFFNEIVECGNWEFNMTTNGSFTSLTNLDTCYNYASEDNKFGELLYYTFDSASGFPQGAGERCSDCTRSYPYTLEKYYKSTTSDVCIIRLQYNNEAFNGNNDNLAYEYGAPNKTIIELVMDDYELRYKIYLINKNPSCMVQSHMLSFNLPFSDSYALINSLGSEINPAEQFDTSISRFHGISEGVKIVDNSDTSNYVNFTIYDSGLVVFGDVVDLVTGSIDNTYTQPDSYSQFHVILQNNWWGQAFMQWYNQNMMSRIYIQFSEEEDCSDTDGSYNNKYIKSRYVVIYIIASVFIMVVV